jgi:hypothetical protein
VRHFTLLAMLATTTLAPADPKSIPTTRKTPEDYLRAVERTADLLATVTDDKSAEAAKAKLDDLFDESRVARTQVFTALASTAGPDAKAAETLAKLTDRLTTAGGKVSKEYDRIGRDHTAAYKMLRDTKLFKELEGDRERTATDQAKALVDAVAFYARMIDGPQIVHLSDLAPNPDDAKRRLLDPWGFPFQYKRDAKRVYVWTVNPHTGAKLGTPPPDER